MLLFLYYGDLFYLSAISSDCQTVRTLMFYLLMAMLDWKVWRVIGLFYNILATTMLFVLL